MTYFTGQRELDGLDQLWLIEWSGWIRDGKSYSRRTFQVWIPARFVNNKRLRSMAVVENLVANANRDFSFKTKEFNQSVIIPEFLK